MNTIKAIETVYNGYRFRSRLEARWAVFFDTLGYDYEYEPQGYDLADGTRYLPDFRLGGNFWIEIKPTTPTIEEIQKARLLAELGTPVYILSGNPWPNEYTVLQIVTYCLPEEARWHLEQALTHNHHHMVGLLLQTFKTYYFGYWEPLITKVYGSDKEIMALYAQTSKVLTGIASANDLALGVCVPCYRIRMIRKDVCPVCGAHGITTSPPMMTAFAAARQARFEFGESGAPRR